MTAALKALGAHPSATKSLRMADEFARDRSRAQTLSLEAAGLFLDYSKNQVTAETMRLLLALAHERGVAAHRDAMMAGERINTTEHRAVLHLSLIHI